MLTAGIILPVLYWFLGGFCNSYTDDILVPVVSGNSVTTECADYHAIRRRGLGVVSDGLSRFWTVRLRP